MRSQEQHCVHSAEFEIKPSKSRCQLARYCKGILHFPFLVFPFSFHLYTCIFIALIQLKSFPMQESTDPFLRQRFTFSGCNILPLSVNYVRIIKRLQNLSSDNYLLFFSREMPQAHPAIY